jgi:hypothetical protein
MNAKSVVWLCLVALLLVSVIEETKACKCMNECGGSHCGQSELMSGCLYDNIYYCNGVYGSTAHHYGPCTLGCRQSGCSLDYCIKENGFIK